MNFFEGLEFEKIDIPALEPLFRERLNSKQLEVMNYSATSLLPINENFQNSLVQLNVTIRRDENAKEERVYLVAKTMEISDEPIPAWSEMFKKEVFAYLELLPAYRDIEREAGVNARELFDPSPRYFGHRYSLDLNSEKIDKHVTLLMDNLAAHGYKSGDKCKGNILKIFPDVFSKLYDFRSSRSVCDEGPHNLGEISCSWYRFEAQAA